MIRTIQYIVAVLVFLLIAQAAKAQAPQQIPNNGGPPPSYLTYQYPVTATVIYRPVAPVAQPVMPAPVVYRRNYWTPLRNCLFGKYRYAYPVAPYPYPGMMYR